MRTRDRETLFIAFGIILILVASALTGCANPILVAKKSINAVGASVHAAHEAWKLADTTKQLAIVDEATSVEEARARIGLWRSSVQPKVNKALGTASAAIATAQRVLMLTEAGVQGKAELMQIVRELVAQWAELRAVLEMYDVKIELPGGF